MVGGDKPRPYARRNPKSQARNPKRNSKIKDQNYKSKRKKFNLCSVILHFYFCILKGNAMRVAMYYDNQDMRLEDMPVPQIGPGELLMPVKGTKCALA